MAHPCKDCGSECYCSGHIDDCIVNNTPASCEGCGCEQQLSDNSDEPDFDDEYIVDTSCPKCNHPYDEIDEEYQICHLCKFDNNKN